MKRKLYEVLASAVCARLNCVAGNKLEWRDKHESKTVDLVKAHMPRGSGFDNGTKIDFDRSTGEKLVFNTAFHHMDGHGFYDGWTEHTVTVHPSLQFGIRITISGKDRNEIKDYIHDCFHYALMTEVE